MEVSLPRGTMPLWKGNRAQRSVKEGPASLARSLLELCELFVELTQQLRDRVLYRACAWKSVPRTGRAEVGAPLLMVTVDFSGPHFDLWPG